MIDFTYFFEKIDIFDLLSSCIALTALWYSHRSNKIARKSYNFQLEKEAKRLPNFSLYVYNLYSMSINKSLYYFAEITVSNLSELNNSISSCELIIHYKVKGSSLIRCLPNLKYIEEDSFNSPYSLSDLPFLVTGNSSKKMYFAFKLPQELYDGASFTKYVLTIKDTQGNETLHETKLMMERNYEV